MNQIILGLLLTLSVFWVSENIHASEVAYVSISDGLPQTQQWKCNPAFGDVNKDGRLDFSAISRMGKGAGVWMNTGKNSWEETSDGLILDSSCGGGVAFGDLNNNGHLDLAVADHCKGLFIYLGNGQGKWQLVSEINMPADDIAVADLSNNGHLDLVACSATNKGIRIFWGTPEAPWADENATVLTATDECHNLLLIDFNQDGILDIAAPMVRTGPRVWLSKTKGEWEEASDGLPRSKSGGHYWGIDAGDINEDGNIDLVIGSTIGGPEIYLGDGKGKWTRAPFQSDFQIQSAWGVALGDINGNNHLDLVVSGKKNSTHFGDAFGVFLFLGNGQGGWRFVADSGLPEKGLFQSWGLSLADLDGDGNLGIGACFGTSATFDSPFLSLDKESSEISVNHPGPGGSLNVWKQKKRGQCR